MSALPPIADIRRLGCDVRFVPLADMADYSAMSALPPIADMDRASSDVRFVPIADIAPLIRSPRRRGRARLRHVEAERLGGLEIDDELVLGRRLHRQVGRLLALQDAIDIAGGAPVLVDEIRPVGDQAAGGDEVAIGVDRGQLVPGRQRDDQTRDERTRARSPSRSGRHSRSARRPRRRARSRRRRAR